MIPVINEETGKGRWFPSIEEATNFCNRLNGELYEKGMAPRWSVYPPDSIPDWADMEEKQLSN